MTFVERLDYLIDQKGTNRNQMLIELNLGKNSFVNWTNRGTLPGGETLLAISKYFDVSIDYLMGKEGDIAKSYPNVSEEDINMLNSLKESDRETVRALMRSLTKK